MNHDQKQLLWRLDEESIRRGGFAKACEQRRFMTALRVWRRYKIFSWKSQRRWYVSSNPDSLRKRCFREGLLCVERVMVTPNRVIFFFSSSVCFYVWSRFSLRTIQSESLLAHDESIVEQLDFDRIRALLGMIAEGAFVALGISIFGAIFSCALSPVGSSDLPIYVALTMLAVGIVFRIVAVHRSLGGSVFISPKMITDSISRFLNCQCKSCMAITVYEEQ